MRTLAVIIMLISFVVSYGQTMGIHIQGAAADNYSFLNTVAINGPSMDVYIKGSATTKSYLLSTIDSITFVLPSDMIIDADGNVYSSVVIGTQTWLVQNLKTTKYNDGTPIQLVTGNSEWVALGNPLDYIIGNGGYCWYNNDVSNKEGYGALYNWYAVNSGKLAPKGWRVSTKADWTTLTAFVDSLSGKLKESGLAYWAAPNTGATNELGFSARGGSLRGASDGSFGNNDIGKIINLRGYWWASTTIPGFASILNNSETILYNNTVSTYGFSVRCVKE